MHKKLCPNFTPVLGYVYKLLLWYGSCGNLGTLCTSQKPELLPAATMPLEWPCVNVALPFVGLSLYTIHAIDWNYDISFRYCYSRDFFFNEKSLLNYTTMFFYYNKMVVIVIIFFFFVSFSFSTGVSEKVAWVRFL